MEQININITSVGIHKMITLDGVELMVFENGDIYRKLFNNWKLVKNTDNNTGYNEIHTKMKRYKRHRIIGHTFLGLDINDTKQLIDHIDRDKLNNNITNLRIVDKQHNSFNTNAKGYSFHKASNKFKAQIKLNNTSIHLGLFTTEQEAKAAYQAAKLIYHKIEPII